RRGGEDEARRSHEEHDQQDDPTLGLEPAQEQPGSPQRAHGQSSPIRRTLPTPIRRSTAPRTRTATPGATALAPSSSAILSHGTWTSTGGTGVAACWVTVTNGRTIQPINRPSPVPASRLTM